MAASYRVSKADVEASRLVFVMLKDVKPMRKVAIPILDGMSFEAFEAQVKAKLRIGGVESMTLATTGEYVTSLAQVQDIDQIQVVAASESAPAVPAFTPAQNGADGAQARQRSSIDHADDPEQKYGKRRNNGWLSKLMPAQPAHQLPITRSNVGEGSMRRGGRKRRRGMLTQRNIIVFGPLLLIALVLSMFYLRALRGGGHHSTDATAAEAATRTIQESAKHMREMQRQAQRAARNIQHATAQKGQDAVETVQQGRDAVAEAGAKVKAVVNSALEQAQDAVKEQVAGDSKDQLPPGIKAPDLKAPKLQAEQGTRLPPNVQAPVRKPVLGGGGA